LIEEYSLMTLESTQTALPTKEIYLKWKRSWGPTDLLGKGSKV
jgi:hypothetical protein